MEKTNPSVPDPNEGSRLATRLHRVEGASWDIERRLTRLENTYAFQVGAIEKRLASIERSLEERLERIGDSIRAIKVRLVRSEAAIAGLLFVGGVVAKALIDMWIRSGNA